MKRKARASSTLPVPNSVSSQMQELSDKTNERNGVRFAKIYEDAAPEIKGMPEIIKSEESREDPNLRVTANSKRTKRRDHYGRKPK